MFTQWPTSRCSYSSTLHGPVALAMVPVPHAVRLGEACSQQEIFMPHATPCAPLRSMLHMSVRLERLQWKPSIAVVTFHAVLAALLPRPTPRVARLCALSRLLGPPSSWWLQQQVPTAALLLLYPQTTMC